MSEEPSPNKNPTELSLLLNAPINSTGTVFPKESPQVNKFNEFVTPSNYMLIGGESRFYPTQYAGPFDRDNFWVAMDHCYARPWNWRPESTFLRPTKTLFIPKPLVNKKKSTNPLAPVQDYDDVIDVEAEVDEPTPIYDKVKASSLMEECEKHAALARIEGSNDDWEETISKIHWNATQNRVFNGMVSILHSDHLARLVHKDTHNEPISRRITIDKSVQRVRKLMATIGWDVRYTLWLHQLLIDNLSTPYLSSYLDMLQTLKQKVPTFVDQMMGTSNSSKLSVLSYESLFPLLKRPWDPVAASLMQDKPKKLPGNPILVVVPSTPIASKRMLKWITLLSNLATVVTIPANYGSSGHKMTMTNFVDQMFVMTRSKIQDIRSDHPNRNIVLIGFNFGATLALQLAQTEQVLCVICMGFSLLTAEGRRGDVDDNLLELQCSVLFIIGQCSNTSIQEDMEDLRERMRVETGLIVVGSADDNLRVNKKKKKSEGITQSVVDRCITDEIGEFISGVILSPYPPQLRQSPTNLSTDGLKKVKIERKRYNSNTSSVDSEPPSPTPRISRPGHNSSPNIGRPPGSKTKSKLEAKWTAQGIPPSPTNSPPPSHTPDTSSNDSFIPDKNTTNPEQLPLRKIKTLKPVISPDKQPSIIQSVSSVKHQLNPGRTLNFQNRQLSTLLQSDLQTIKSCASGIKVLENVKLTSGSTSKFLTSGGRPFDMSKISVINSPKSVSSSSNSPIVLLPDGKIKNMTPGKGPWGRYITSKRQLVGSKPPKPYKKISYVPQTCSMQSADFTPPSNLTTQDIMDLPIIFADDNQVLDNTSSPSQTEIKPPPQIVTVTQPSKIITANTGSKFVLINKQISLQNNPNNFIITSSNLSKVTQQPTKMTTPKYTKIILSSKKTPADEAKTTTANILTKIPNLSSEISIKKITPVQGSPATSQADVLDLENEIAASTVYKTSAENKGHVEETGKDVASNKFTSDEGKAESEQKLKRLREDAENSENRPRKVTKIHENN